MDYRGPLSEVVRPLVPERVQRRTDDPLDPVIKLLDRDIQRLIRQDAQDQWKSLLESSDRATNPKRYWSLLHKLGGKRSNPPSNISIAFDGKTYSSPKAIARAFNRQVTACSAQQDQAIRRLMRNLQHHHRVVPSYRPFDERGFAAAIRKSGTSTAQGPDGLTMLHLRQLGPHGLAFLTELFNLSIAGINIPVIWKNSVIILKSGKPREQIRSYRPISLLCPPMKILERLLLSSVEELGTRPSQHGFKPRHSTASALLPISARVVSGFNQLKPPSRTINIVVDISKAFDTISHRLIIEMIHRSRLCHNLVRWIVAYLRGRRVSCIYQQHRSPSRRVWAGVPQGSVISPALFNHFVSDCPTPDLDVTSYADDFTLLASAPSIVAAEGRANQLYAKLVRKTCLTECFCCFIIEIIKQTFLLLLITKVSILN